MISISDLNQISDITDEGRMLVASLAILTTIDCQSIKNGEVGSKSTPYEILEKIVHLANLMYYEKEYLIYRESLKRDNKIENILSI